MEKEMEMKKRDGGMRGGKVVANVDFLSQGSQFGLITTGNTCS